MPLFGPSFNGAKLKVCLKLCITRLQMLQKKKENQGVLSRKEIATLLGKNKEELARIRVEQIIRDDYVVEVLEILELYCTLLTSRFGLIEAVKECDPGLMESVQTIMWCAPRLQAEVNELKQIAHAFGVRYGKEFIRQAMSNLDDTEDAQPGSGKVSARVMHKLTDYTPKASLVDNYLVAIAQTYGVEYIPPIRPPEADLLGGSANPTASAPTLFDFPSAPLGTASGAGATQHLPIPTDFPGSDYPPAPGGGGGGSGFDMLFPSPPAGVSASGPALYPPPQAAQYPPQQPPQVPDLSYLPPAAGFRAPSGAQQQQQQQQQGGFEQPPPPQQLEEGPPPPAAEGVGGLMAQPPVQHFQEKMPGGFPNAPAPGDAPPSYTGGGGGGSSAAPGVGVGFDSWDTPSIGGASSASVGPPGSLPPVGGGYNPGGGPTYAAIGSVVPEQTYHGYTGGEPTYEEIPGDGMPAVPLAQHGSMANETYGANPSQPQQPSGGDAPPDFDELARRFQNLRDKNGD